MIESFVKIIIVIIAIIINNNILNHGWKGVQETDKAEKRYAAANHGLEVEFSVHLYICWACHLIVEHPQGTRRASVYWVQASVYQLCGCWSL